MANGTDCAKAAAHNSMIKNYANHNTESDNMTHNIIPGTQHNMFSSISTIQCITSKAV